MKKLLETFDEVLGDGDVPAVELDAVTKRVNDVLLQVFGQIGGKGQDVHTDTPELDLNAIHEEYGVLWSLSEMKLWHGLVAVAYPESGGVLICLYYLRDDKGGPLLNKQDAIVIQGQTWEDFQPHLVGWTSKVRAAHLEARPECAPECAPERFAALEAAADAIWNAGDL